MRGPSDEVRAHCAAVAAAARHVAIDEGALDAFTIGEPPPPLDPTTHFLEGSEEDVAAYVLTLDAVNFGSGWFAELGLPSGGGGYEVVARGLAERFRAHGPWRATELRGMDRHEVAEMLALPAAHRLMALFADALRELGAWLGERTPLQAVTAAGTSAQRMVAELARMPMWRDTGYLKRAQIAVSDLALAGVATFGDLETLTVFADNLLPHVLRVDGVLRLDPALEADIDAGRALARGGAEAELRACSVVACARIAERAGMIERDVDNVLWTRGLGARYRERPPHRCLTVFY
jgi:hypothetical protein